MNIMDKRVEVAFITLEDVIDSYYKADERQIKALIKRAIENSDAVLAESEGK